MVAWLELAEENWIFFFCVCVFEGITGGFAISRDLLHAEVAWVGSRAAHSCIVPVAGGFSGYLPLPNAAPEGS